MSLWISDFLTPDTLLRHLALFLVVVAVAMPTVALVRWFALAAGVVGLVTTTVVGAVPAEAIWWGVLVIVAIVRLLLASNWRVGGRLTAE